MTILSNELSKITINDTSYSLKNQNKLRRLIKFLPETKRILGEHELVLESKVNQQKHCKDKK
jgi:hypothetical protein